MQQIITIKLLPSEASQPELVKDRLALETGKKTSAVTGFHILKHSIDARNKTPLINLQCNVFINEPFQKRKVLAFDFKDVHKAKNSVVIIGAGPAGLFAALKCIENGVKPIILERGKDVRSRRRDLAHLNKEGEINPESNYCFGEGGAGTYSDGKLYTRSTKRGDVNRILNLLVHFGADDKILYEAHPHIGTNKLPGIITAMRQQIVASGGECRFEEKLTDLLIQDNHLKGVITAKGETISTQRVILATGHSARDIFELLNSKKILIEFKPFAIGVRVEHPQEIIDNIQYHSLKREPFLPPASYSVVDQVDGRGVFSFCMCPGGIIAPASTDANEVVVNGWSPSKRNNPFANSGIVVSIEEKDAVKFSKHGHLAGMYFQKDIEQKAYTAGGGKFVAPAQRLIDFTNNKVSSSLPDCSYLPGIHSTSINNVLPSFIHNRLKLAFREFGNKMKGYLTNEAVVVATESRTSSPVRIPRNPQTLEHPQIHGLYPCGEGAGFAGGIVSAAMDGERIVEKILLSIKI
ncbi:MAG TPA: NAD(P)/FAD-dependent oxidoreductase [Chitinophagaceae bacterium]|nr:NAD(P)/FAD-dependent oxidoreductase [Chitinophagaceae bacterium]